MALRNGDISSSSSRVYGISIRTSETQDTNEELCEKLIRTNEGFI